MSDRRGPMDKFDEDHLLKPCVFFARANSVVTSGHVKEVDSMNHATFCTLFAALAASSVMADVEEFHSPTSKWSYDFLGTPTNIAASVNGSTFATSWDVGNG